MKLVIQTLTYIDVMRLPMHEGTDNLLEDEKHTSLYEQVHFIIPLSV